MPGWCNESGLTGTTLTACPERFIPPIPQEFANDYNFDLLNRVYWLKSWHWVGYWQVEVFQPENVDFGGFGNWSRANPSNTGCDVGLHPGLCSSPSASPFRAAIQRAFQLQDFTLAFVHLEDALVQSDLKKQNRQTKKKNITSNLSLEPKIIIAQIAKYNV